MQGLLLVAGRGSRMGDLNAPKCLSTLAGRTLLERQLAALRAGGVTRIGLVRGYRAELLSPPDTTLFDNPRWSETNMVATLRVASPWLRSGPVIVSYGDIFYGCELVSRLAAAQGDIVVAYDLHWRSLWERRFAEPLSDAETFRIMEGGRLVEIGGRAARLDDIAGQYMGLLKFSPAGWRVAEDTLAQLPQPQQDGLDMTALLRRLLADGVAVWTVATSGNWGEVDSMNDLRLYEEMVHAGEIVLDSGASSPQ